ncbi:hypothetical protein [Paenibacillus silvisoli]|uniref:hypothetical protein n=1 Tax=Paenibacillus silvisoli TaxID=3110539 RepID=UPI0028048F61|nr:hypothetical protein [Paenibacillus silvisoli]
MILFLYVVINAAAAAFFIRLKKRLHILEILMYWFAASYMYQNFSAFCYMNFKTFLIPDQLSYEFAHFFSRMVLYPALMVVSLHLYLGLCSFWTKLLLALLYTGLFTGLEWMDDWLGVVVHTHWHFWWSPVFWLGTWIFLLGFMTAFRKVLFRRNVPK